MTISLHDILVEVSIEFIHGHEEFLVFQIHCEFAHVNQLILFGEVAGNIKTIESLDEYALNISEGLPILLFIRIGLFSLEPSSIKLAKLDKDV